jgi:hypothetical protein
MIPTLDHLRAPVAGAGPLMTALLVMLTACASSDTDDKASHPTTSDQEAEDGSESDTPQDGDPDADGDDPPTGQDTPTDTGDAPEVIEDDAAQLVSIDFPSEIGCSQEASGTVTMRNTGNHVWTRTGGFKLGAVGDEDPIYDSSDTRVWLAAEVSVARGQTHKFDIPLIGTETAGTVLSDWQMVREGVQWFGESAQAEVNISCEDSGSSTPALELPDMSDLVYDLAEEYPDLLADSCLADGGSWGFLDLLVDELRTTDTRWGYNWKRGVEGDASQDVVDYHWGSGPAEGSTDVYIIDVIVGHCGESPDPGWLDQTTATADAGTIGRWTGRYRF